MSRTRRQSTTSLSVGITSLNRQISIEAGASPLALYTSRTNQNPNPHDETSPFSARENIPQLDTVFSPETTPTIEETGFREIQAQPDADRFVPALSKDAKYGLDRHESGNNTLCSHEGKSDGGNEEKGDLERDGEGQQKNHDGVEEKKLSKTRMILLGAAMMLTYFLGVSCSAYSSMRTYEC